MSRLSTGNKSPSIVRTGTRGGNDNSYFYTGERDFAKFRPFTAPEQRLFFSRFDQQHSLRKGLTTAEKNRQRNLGPYLYDPVLPRSRGGECRFNSVKRSNIPIRHSLHAIFEPEKAPPVGHYNIPRIMGFEGCKGAEIGVEISSSFKNTDRSTILTPDCNGIISSRQESDRALVGPGYYTFPDAWEPKAFFKYNKKYPKEHRTRVPRDESDKPWTVQKLKKSRQKVHGNGDRNGDTNRRDAISNEELMEIRNLRSY